MKPILWKEFRENFEKGVVSTIALLFLSIISIYIIYILPEIVPEEINIIVKDPRLESAKSFLKNLSQIGIMIAILFGADAVAGEVSRGTLEYLLSKPIKIYKIILSKFFIRIFFIVIAYYLSTIISWLYIDILFGYFSLEKLLVSTSIILLTTTFSLSLSILLSSIFNTTLTAGIIAIAVNIILSIICSINLDIVNIIPLKYIENAFKILETDAVNIINPLGISLTYTSIILAITTKIVENKESIY